MTLRFACELAALGALGWWGVSTGGAPLAIVGPVAAGVLWGTWVAPKARHRLRDPARFAVESIVWVAAVAALVSERQLVAAIVLGVVALATAIGARRYEPQVRNLDGSSRRDA
ncbi:MAG: YrdB family protein [Acidobacteriota bacterium]